MEPKTILIVEDDDACGSGTEKALQRDYELQRSRGKDHLRIVRVYYLLLRFRQTTRIKFLPVSGVQDGLG